MQGEYSRCCFSEDEISRAYRTSIVRHATRPEFGCRILWQNNSVLVWDKRCTMYRAVPDFLESLR